MNTVLVYITAGSMEEARRIGRLLVSERLAACINILSPMQSIYEWEGVLEEAAEVVVIAKTQADRLEALTDAVVSAHSYDCPCVLHLPVAGGHIPFLDWITSQVS
jgi:periplasmic divalent cation tolerance protein